MIGSGVLAALLGSAALGSSRAQPLAAATKKSGAIRLIRAADLQQEFERDSEARTIG